MTHYTKPMFGRELKKRVLEQQDVVEIGIWAHSVYSDCGAEVDADLLGIMLDLNTMELGGQFVISYEMLNKIADALIANKDVDLNSSEYRDDNTTYYTKNYSDHIVGYKNRFIAELYHEVIGNDVYFKLKAKMVDMAANNEITALKIGLVIGIDPSSSNWDVLNDTWIYCENTASFQLPLLKCTTRSELSITAAACLFLDSKDRPSSIVKMTINNPQPKGGEIDPITNAVKIISPIRKTTFFQDQNV